MTCTSGLGPLPDREPEELRREAARILRDVRAALDLQLGTALQMLQRAERIESARGEK